MPNFFEAIGKVEPCDGRDLLQKLTYTVVSEVAKKKAKLCTNLEETFADFGLENFSPCSLITTSNLERLLNGETEQVINTLLLPKGLPPHTFKVLKQGYKSLNDLEKRDLDKYLTGLTTSYIRGQVEPIIQEKIAEIIKCPDEATARRILVKLENTLKTVNKLQDRVNKLDSYITPTSATVSALNAAFKAADVVILGLDISLPAQAATPTGVAGLTARIIGRVERFIDNNRDGIQKLDDNLCNAAKAIRFANTQLTIIKTFLEIIDIFLQSCAIKTGDQEGFASRITPTTFNNTLIPTEYRGYRLEIREDRNDSGIAPRRYAVALDPVGVVVLRGVSSFSSNTDILIEELKFRIDNQLG